MFRHPNRFRCRTDCELSDTDQDEEISNLQSESYDGEFYTSKETPRDMPDKVKNILNKEKIKEDKS